MPDPPMMPNTAFVMTTPDQLVATYVRLYCDAIIKHSAPDTRDPEMPTKSDRDKRQSIIDACRSMNALGINQGTSGNISLRHDDGLLITPTSVPYETMQPEQIVFMRLDGSHDPSQRPSSEWRFHLDILRARPPGKAPGPSPPPQFTLPAGQYFSDP